MAKTKKKRLMTSILDGSANYYLGGGDTNSYYTQQMVTDNDGMRRMQFMPSESTMTNPFGQESAYNGAYKMGKLSYNDFDYQNMTPEAQQQFDAYNQQVKDNNKLYRQNQRAYRQEQRQLDGNKTGGALANAIPAAANAMITAFQDKNANTATKVAAALGAPELGKIWSADWDEGNKQLDFVKNKINDATNKLIQDSNDTHGAFSAIKNNNQLNLIDASPSKQLSWKDFRGNLFKKGAVATLQGAASGSVGGPWGALGGATVGTLGALFGGIGAKKRAKRAYEEYKDKLNYLQTYASNFNSLQRLNQQQSNENLLNNGLKQQRIQDLANINAYGGNLYWAGGDTETDPTPSLYDVGTSPLGLKRMAYTDTRFVPKQLTPISYGSKVDPNGEWAAAANYIADYDNQRMDLWHKNLDEINAYRKKLGSPYDYTANKLATLANETSDANRNLFIEKKQPVFNPRFDLAGTFFPKVARSNLSNVIIKAPEGDYALNSGAGGIYRGVDEKDLKLRHTVTTDDKYLQDLDKKYGTNYFDTSKVHELAHSRGLDSFYEQIMAAKGFTKDWEKLTPEQQEIYNKYPVQKDKDGRVNRNYWLTPTEVISRRYEARKTLGLHPRDIVTKEFLEKPEVKKVIQDNHLDVFTNDQLTTLFNEIADNNNSKQYDNVAAMGGQFDFNLSPNMIDLQNQSLANQKYKYMNQMQPAGFIGGGDKEPNPGIPRFACGGKLHLNKFDFGGSMSMEDLPDNLQVYGNGGTHEENPNGGIQVGVDQQGIPNFTEEGEVRYGDYVFSDRINVDPELLTEFNLAPATKHQNKKANKGKLSYADMAKKMIKKAGDLNDPITKDTVDANMGRLKNAQEAQKFREQQDQQLADYKSALKTPTQGNPMYGSMKYNGMGDVNQGLNEGVDSGMGAMDNSSLSNVNRSGNEMMAAYGGNLFAGGTPNLNIRRINEPALNWNDLVIQRSLPTPQYMTGSNVGNDMLVEPVDYSQMARNYDDNWLNDKWNAYGELNNYYTPEQIANLRGSFGMSISGGVDKPFVQALQQDLKNRGYYKGKIDGDFGPNTRMALDKMNGTYAWTGENGKYVAPQTQTIQTVTTNTGNTPGSQSYGHSFSVDKTTTKLAKDDVVDNNINVSKDATASGTTQNPQQSVNSLGDLQKLNAQYATGNPFDAPSYSTLGKFAANAKFLPAVFADSTGFTNFDFNPNLNPNRDLVAAGRTGYVPRTADHSGMYKAADLYDINLANNAAQAQAAATARAMSNVNDRNQRAANQLAADYNAALGVGNNYQTMFDANMKSRLATDEYNKQTEQTNVAANNDMYRDNQNAGIQAKQMELNTLAQSMADQTQKELYADRTNREAHDNIAGNQNAMWNNTMQFFMDEAQRNDLYNKFNSDASQMWYYDKKLGKYVFKGDPAQDYLGTAMRTAENPVTSLDADLLKQYNDYVAKVGSQNVSREFIDNLVYQQGQRNKENEAKSIADRNAQMQSDIDFMNTQFQDLDNLTITDKDKSYKFFDYINSPKQVEAVRNFLANADVSQMNPNDYKNYKALLDNWMRMRDRQLMYRNQISPYNVADATNTTWVGQGKESAYGGYINSNKKKKKQYYTDI